MLTQIYGVSLDHIGNELKTQGFCDHLQTDLRNKA